MKEFVITFGPGHKCIHGESLQHVYVIVHAEDDEGARERIHWIRGDRWASIYPKHSLMFLAARWNLMHMPLSRVYELYEPKS